MSELNCPALPDLKCRALADLNPLDPENMPNDQDKVTRPEPQQPPDSYWAAAFEPRRSSYLLPDLKRSALPEKCRALADLNCRALPGLNNPNPDNTTPNEDYLPDLLKPLSALLASEIYAWPGNRGTFVKFSIEIFKSIFSNYYGVFEEFSTK